MPIAKLLRAVCADVQKTSMLGSMRLHGDCGRPPRGVGACICCCADFCAWDRVCDCTPGQSGRALDACKQGIVSKFFLQCMYLSYEMTSQSDTTVRTTNAQQAMSSVDTNLYAVQLYYCRLAVIRGRCIYVGHAGSLWTCFAVMGRADVQVPSDDNHCNSVNYMRGCAPLAAV
jgi:hypothetical protein